MPQYFPSTQTGGMNYGGYGSYNAPQPLVYPSVPSYTNYPNYGNYGYVQNPNPIQPIQTPPAQNVQQTTQQMSLPTIKAEIIQVDNEQAARDSNVPANIQIPSSGYSQMFMTKDERFIFIKTTYPNTPYDFVMFERKVNIPESAPMPSGQNSSSQEIKMGDYITRDEFESRMTDMMKRQKYKPKNDYSKPHYESVKDDNNG